MSSGPVTGELVWATIAGVAGPALTVCMGTMMAFWDVLKIAIAIVLVAMAPALAGRLLHGSISFSTARSELSLSNLFGATEYPFLNLLKAANQWDYADNSGHLKPDELTSDGYPLAGGSWISKSGAKDLIVTPSQAERPGHYVLMGTGGVSLRTTFNGSGVLGLVSCTGAGGTFGTGVSCDNTGCSSFLGSISQTTLTVTSPPTGSGCTLGAGVPISGSGIFVSKFGTPTIITSSGSTCGANTCYTVNQSQTVSSITMNIGWRLEWSVTTPFPTTAQDIYSLVMTNTSSGNNADNVALLHISDESAYWASATPCGLGQACILGGLFKTRIQQGNFAVLRDLDWSVANESNCTTWSSRKPITYYSYPTPEPRNASSGPGQYVNSAGTGASGGVVSYNSGTDTYSITLGSGGPADKQTILMLPPATGTSSSRISLNGTTSVPILTSYGSTGASAPTLGALLPLVYDAVIGGFLSFNINGGSINGLDCGVPPEVFIEINAELRTTPWHTLPYLALDPMTDWVKQYATYIKANYPSIKPFFEVTNEPFNCVTFVPAYLSVKSKIYISETRHGQAIITAAPVATTMPKSGKWRLRRAKTSIRSMGLEITSC